MTPRSGVARTERGPQSNQRTSPARLHRAWLVAAVTLGALVAAAAFRSSTGVLIEPLEAEFGWSRTVTSGAVSLNLALFGLTAPFAAALMERWGVRRVVALALALVGLASAATTVMTAPWQLWLLWGLAIGVGTGSMALVFGAIVAQRWFYTHRGLATGVFSAANATGQLVFLPLLAAAASGPGWRYAAWGVAVMALVMLVPVLLWLADSPEQVGTRPYGAPDDEGAGSAEVPPASARPSAEVTSAATMDVTEPATADPDPPRPPASATRPDSTRQTPTRAPSAARVAFEVLRRASGSWTFWALMLTFWVCGWSTNGLIQTHFVAAAHDHGMPATTAAGLLALVGAFDIVGTVASGWLTDRVDPRALLGMYYSLRGVALLTLPALLAPNVQPSLWVFIIFYGLDWVATVPPTVALCRIHFGLADSGVVFGWVFASHMVGAGVGAGVAGFVRAGYGDYRLAWLSAGGLCLMAAVAAVSIPRDADTSVSQPVSAVAG